jgi:hypothetical protein
MREQRARGTVAVIAFILIACLGVVLPLDPVAAGSRSSAFPCVDVNGDKECTPGVDTDVSGQLELGAVSTPGHVVVPADVLGSSKSIMGIYAGGDITVHGKLRAAGLTLWGGGKVTVGPEAVLNGKDGLDIYAGGDIELQTGAMLKTGGVLYLLSWYGSISGGDVTMEAKDGIEVSANGGAVSFAAGAKLQSPGGEVRLYATGDITVNGTSLRGASAMLFTESHVIDFKDGSLSLTSRDGTVHLITQGSRVDISRTKMRNVKPENLFIDAAEVINEP